MELCTLANLAICNAVCLDNLKELNLLHVCLCADWDGIIYYLGVFMCFDLMQLICVSGLINWC